MTNKELEQLKTLNTELMLALLDLVSMRLSVLALQIGVTR